MNGREAVYEYQFNVYVEAVDKEEAWETVRHISRELDKLDVEGTSLTEGPWEVDVATGKRLTE